MAIQLFTVANISDGEFGKQVKFQIKTNGVSEDAIGKKEWKHSITYYRWYTSLNDNVKVGMSVNLDPDKYDIRKQEFEVEGKMIELSYLYDKK